MAYAATHCRMDALFFGVLLGYFYHFHAAALEGFIRPAMNRLGMALGSAILISFAWLPPLHNGNRFEATIGFTFIYVGFGVVLLLALYVHGILPKGIAWAAGKIGSVFAFAGVYSYSIYLWHGPTGAWFPVAGAAGDWFSGRRLAEVLPVISSIEFAIGIAMSKLIEYPILRLRDHLFPQPQVVAVAPDVAGA